MMLRYICTYIQVQTSHANVLYSDCLHTNILKNVLHVVAFLREDSEQELSLLVRLECGRHDAVDTGRQVEPATHFSHVDERGRPRHWRVVCEEVCVQRSRQVLWVIQLHKVYHFRLIVDLFIIPPAQFFIYPLSTWRRILILFIFYDTCLLHY